MSIRRMLGLTAAVATLVTSLGAAQAAWPEKPITLIVPYAAGGGTDATGRWMAAGLEPILGQPVNVVNRVGASGLTGMSAIANAAPDGYTIGLIANAIGRFHWEGSDVSYKTITPLCMFNVDWAGFQLGPSKANITNFKEALADLKANPDKWNLGGGGRLGTWHMAFIHMALMYGMDPKAYTWIASGGAAPSLTELAAGGIDLAPTSLPEAKGLLDAGKIRAVAVMGTERIGAFPDVPTIEEAEGTKVSFGSFRGMAGPANLPKDVADTLIAAMRKVYDSADFQKAMESQGYGVRWMQGEEFMTFLAANDESTGKILEAVK